MEETVVNVVNCTEKVRNVLLGRFCVVCYCCRYEGDKSKGLYNGKGVAYFVGGHSYEV